MGKIEYDKMQEVRANAINNAAMLAERGDIATSKALTEKAQKLEEEMKEIKESNKVTSAGDFVCELCGIRCSMDEERLTEAHQWSNLHKAYTKIRQKAKELKDKLGDSRDERHGDRSDDKDR